MPELYPSDAALLALTRDEHVGLEYIPTGASPYHLHFRRLLHRLLLAAARSNDLRVYPAGPLSVGVCAGRGRIGTTSFQFPPCANQSLAPHALTCLWLNAAGTLQLGPDFPSDLTSHLPLARVATHDSAITAIDDLRGQVLWRVPSLPALGVVASAQSINTALCDAASSVSADALNKLTAGPASSADACHRHAHSRQSIDGPLSFTLTNDHPGLSASVALAFALPAAWPDELTLALDRDSGFLIQRRGPAAYPLVGTAHIQFVHAGPLTASLSGALAAAVPMDGRITGVWLSAAANLVSSAAADAVTAIARVNGQPMTLVHPSLPASLGPGFASTAQGQGTPALVRDDAAAHVRRGDLLTIDLLRQISGNVTAPSADLAVLVALRPEGPE